MAQNKSQREIKSCTLFKAPTKADLDDHVHPREHFDDVERGERDVEEEPNLAGKVLLFGRLSDRVGGKHQVVVVNPDQRDLDC